MATKPILYVESEPNDVILMKIAFEEAGVDVPLQVAPCGEDAIDYLAGNGPFADRDRYPMPAMVIIQPVLPRTTGVEVLQWIRTHETTRRIPVIVYSSAAPRPKVVQYVKFGANSFIVKPFTMEERVALVRTLIDYWFMWNHESHVAA